MLENTKELEAIASRLPCLYDKFVEVDENGIKIMVKCKVEQVPEPIPESAIKEIVDYLLDKSMERLKNTKYPVIFFLLYEKNGLRMDVAYSSRKIYFWKRWLATMYFLRLRWKYPSDDYTIRHRVVEMNFEGRDCICHSIRF